MPTTPTSPSLTPTVNTNIRSSAGTSIDILINQNVKQLKFKETKNFDLFNQNKLPNIGKTIIPNPLTNIKIQSPLNFVLLPVGNFLTNVSNFIVDKAIVKNNKYSNTLINSLSAEGVNINKYQDLVKISLKPITLKKTENPSDVFNIQNNGISMSTNISYDNNLNGLIQTIKITPNTKIILNSNNVKSIKYLNKTFDMNNSIVVLTPERPGMYTILSSNIPLRLEVVDIKGVENTIDSIKPSFWNKIIKTIKGVFQ